ncbi:hypothetical protein B0J12DRAFT_754333, partial [Macrophomina phaseolina]
QALVIESVARTTSAISLAGCLFILITFAFFPAFRKPINRLIVYASIGNVLTNVATVISVAAIPYYSGASWALCRFQGFFIQMFMPADSLWTLCMALNVYLTFFKAYNSVDLRALELRYFISCYGICLVPALIYLILDESRLQTGIYGDAVLWCWVGEDWEWMRIAFFYGPVWCVIVVTIGIYCYTGKVIFKQRKALSAFKVVTSEAIPSDDNLKAADLEADARSSFSSTRNLSGTTSTHGQSSNPNDKHSFPRYEPNHAVWPYSNAVSGANGDTKNVFTTSVSAGAPVPTQQLASFEARHPTSSGPCHRKNSTARYHANTAAWGYAKVSFLMFVALFVVWIPSTVNRVWALAHPTEVNYALNVTAAFVLPTQGFWNFTIYVSTSWSQCRDAWEDVREFFSCRRSLRRTSNPDLEMSDALRQQSARGTHAEAMARIQRIGSEGGNMSFTEALDMDTDGSEKNTVSPYSSRPPTRAPTSERDLTQG